MASETSEPMLTGRQKMRSRTKSRAKYNPSTLASWSSLGSVYGSVLAERALWRIVGMCFLISCIVASGIAFVPGIHNLNDSQGLERVNLIIRVLLAFILALYLSACVNRWWQSMERVTEYFESVKQLHMDVSVMSPPSDRLAAMRRYMLLSSALLHHEVVSMWIKNEDKTKEVWSREVLKCRRRGWLSEDEQQRLELAHPEHRAELVWSWIGTVLSMQIVDLKSTPPLASRVTVLGGRCIETLQWTKCTVAQQIPLTYVHIVAVLVHANNIILAVTSGITIGISMQAAHRFDHALDNGRDISGRREGLLQSVQIIVMRLFYMVISPLVYQAFLHIGSCMNDPFSEDYGHGTPLGEFIDDLEESFIEVEALASQKVTLARPTARVLQRDSEDS